MKPVGEGSAVPVTDDPAHDWQPDWSPVGNEIVFRSERAGGGLYVVPATGGTPRRLTDFGRNPLWSPDGTRIFFIRGKTVRPGAYTVRPDDQSLRRIDVSQLSAEQQAIALNTLMGWDTQGRRVLFLTVFGEITLESLNIETGIIERHRVDDAVRRRSAELQLRVEEQERRLVTTPDGASVYIIALSQEIRSVWRFDIDPRTLALAGGPHRVTSMTESHTSFAMSRDGSKLAFDVVNLRGQVKVYPLDASGQIGGPAVFESSPTLSSFRPELSPDGDRSRFKQSVPEKQNTSTIFGCGRFRRAWSVSCYRPM
jgi:Tol biopolymer transport system component